MNRLKYLLFKSCNWVKLKTQLKGICEAQGATAEEVFGCFNCEKVNKKTLKNLPDLDPQNKYVAKRVRLKRTATGGAVVGSVFGIAILAGLGFLTYKKVSHDFSIWVALPDFSVSSRWACNRKWSPIARPGGRWTRPYWRWSKRTSRWTYSCPKTNQQ